MGENISRIGHICLVFFGFIHNYTSNATHQSKDGVRRQSQQRIKMPVILSGKATSKKRSQVLHKYTDISKGYCILSQVR